MADLKVFELKNENGMKVKITNYGAAIMSVVVPAKGGEKDVVHGFDTPEEYKNAHPFFGVVCGRVANRIKGGKFTLDGKAYQLEQNEGEHHLHGGSNGFDKKVWDVESADSGKIALKLFSPDGDSSYPGDLTVKVIYSLNNSNVLRIDYEASTDTKTIANITNHSYFNLCGHSAPNIYGQEMTIYSDKITECGEGIVPTGGFYSVEGTAFDFRTAKPLGRDLEEAAKLNDTGGYDHNYCLRGEGKAAEAFSPNTGIRMTVSTNSPGMQLYTGNFLQGDVSGKGACYGKHSGFCLETQLYPDAINNPGFPSSIVEKGKPQKFYTEFIFEW